MMKERVILIARRNTPTVPAYLAIALVVGIYAPAWALLLVMAALVFVGVYSCCEATTRPE